MSMFLSIGNDAEVEIGPGVFLIRRRTLGAALLEGVFADRQRSGQSNFIDAGPYGLSGKCLTRFLIHASGCTPDRDAGGIDLSLLALYIELDHGEVFD